MEAKEVCDVCGASTVIEVKCKLICQNCGTILRSCADLSALNAPIITARLQG